MKKIYITPKIEMVIGRLQTAILSGSGDSDHEIGETPSTGETGTTKPKPGGGSLAKENHFDAWESWDEY